MSFEFGFSALRGYPEKIKKVTSVNFASPFEIYIHTGKSV